MIGIGILAFAFVSAALGFGIFAYKFITLKKAMAQMIEGQSAPATDVHEMTDKEEGQYASIDVSDIDVTPTVYDRVHNTDYEQVG